MLTTAVLAICPAVALGQMTAHFPLNEGKGTEITDQVGGLVGELTNADEHSWSEGPTGVALRLGGVGQCVIVPNDDAFDFADESFSVAFWTRWKQGSKPHHQYFICKGDYSPDVSGETGKRWEINIRERGFSFIIDDNTNKSVMQVSGKPILESEWVHVVAIRDREAKRLKVYFDGELQEPNEPDDEDYIGTDNTGSISNPRELVIGDSTRLDNALEGEMADVRIYREALSEEQIDELVKLGASETDNP